MRLFNLRIKSCC